MRVGPSMRAALRYLQAHPGETAAQVDRAVRTARGGHRWMYATVQRCERAGLLTREHGTRGARPLYLTREGHAYLASRARMAF